MKQYFAAAILASAATLAASAANAGFTTYNSADFEPNAADQCVAGKVAAAESAAAQMAAQVHERTLQAQDNSYLRSYDTVTPERPYRRFTQPVAGMAATFAQDLHVPDYDEMLAAVEKGKDVENTLRTSWRIEFDAARLAEICSYETGERVTGTNPNMPVSAGDMLSTSYVTMPALK